MAGRFSVDEEMGIGRLPDRLAHRGQTSGEPRRRQLKLADEDAPRNGNLETSAGGAGSQSQRKIGDQQRLSDSGFAADEANPGRRQQAGFDKRWRGCGVMFEQLPQRQYT